MSTTSIMVAKTQAEHRPVEAPTVIFTLARETASVQVMNALEEQLTEILGLLNSEGIESPELRVFESPDDVEQFFAEHSHRGWRSGRAVVLFDGHDGKAMRHTFRGGPHRPKLPDWAANVKWGVSVTPGMSRERSVANQIRADYVLRFRERVAEQKFPWGLPRHHESGPVELALPGDVRSRLLQLNSGPDFLSDVDPKHVQSLPPGSRISCNRVVVDAYDVDATYLASVLDAFEALELASNQLVLDEEAVRRQLLEGVHLGLDQEPMYLHPRTQSFSVRRLDLHLKGPAEVFASENDEMPGGISQAWWYDLTYGVNQDRWQYAWRWLTRNGPLLFLVSHCWSKVYVSEMQQMTDRLTEEGWPVRCATTDELEGLQVWSDGVYFGGQKVGAVWRLFPVFETRGKLAEIVAAAQAGEIELVPEFAHFGNKAWFSLFREYEKYFRAVLSAEHFATLDRILPDSLLVPGAGGFPSGKDHVGEISLSSFQELRNLGEKQRDQLVLKVVGANPLSARSYGVLMGHGLTTDTWNRWIDDRLREKEPFIIQQAEPTEVRHEAVLNTTTGAVEYFDCRVLLRPWQIGGVTISVPIIGVTKETRRVHGMTDMFIAPVDLGEMNR